MLKFKQTMTYLTSWDSNVFWCLVSLGIPDDVVKVMLKLAKKKHEEFSLGEAMAYWLSNSPQLECHTPLGPQLSHRTKRHIFSFNNIIFSDHEKKTRLDTWKNRRKSIIEFKRKWRLRSIEDRKRKVIDWCKFGDEWYQQRLRVDRLRNFSDESYKNNLWSTWDAWSHCEHQPMIMNWDTVRPQPWDRRTYISQWYEGIHPGRFFLFYKKNKIIEERNKGVPSGPCEDGYKYPQIPIIEWGPYEQLIEDLRCIDGPGLGESGSKVEHIDDIFSH